MSVDDRGRDGSPRGVACKLEAVSKRDLVDLDLDFGRLSGAKRGWFDYLGNCRSPEIFPHSGLQKLHRISRRSRVRASTPSSCYCWALEQNL